MAKLNLVSKKYPNLHTEIDDEYYDEVSKIIWYPEKKKNRTAIYAIGKYKNKNVYLHRFIMKLLEGDSKIIVDHIDKNGLNNKKENLRLCTQAENLRNSEKRKSKKQTSIYKGVEWKKDRNKWRCRIKYNYKSIHLGTFEDEKEAALAYNKKAKELFGEFASLNIL